MSNQEKYQQHLSEILSHMRSHFDIHDISGIVPDGSFEDTGFCVKIQNEMESDSVAGVVELHFDRRSYMIGFVFNIVQNPTAICLELKDEFSVENSFRFINVVKYFMNHIDVRMANEHDVDVLLDAIDRGETFVDDADKMSIEGIIKFWKKCLNSKILA